MSYTGSATVDQIEDTIRDAVKGIAPVIAAGGGTQSEPAPATATFGVEQASIIADTVQNLEHYADRMDVVLTRIGRQHSILVGLSDLLHARTVGQ